MLEEVMRAYSDPAIAPRLLVLSGITFLFGYVQYIYSFRLVLRERKGPFPIWMHTLYLAHDFTGAVVFYLLAQQHDWFWFFSATSIALLVWNGFELFNLYMAIKVERQEIWGRFYAAPVTERQALLRIVGQVALFFAVVNLLRAFMDDTVMFKWFVLTNIVMCVAPGFLWNERQSRSGSSVGLAVILVLTAINTFLPPGFGMFATASGFFDQPWFYITGLVVTAFAVRNLFMLLKFQPKPASDGRKPIW